MIVRKCNLCSAIDPHYSDDDADHCGECAILINNIQMDAYRVVGKRLEKKYDAAIMNRAHIMNLFEDHYQNHRDDFTTIFGTTALNMLERALGVTETKFK